MNTLQMEAIEFSQTFDYNQFSIISNPGKFEGEPQLTPYFYFMTLESAQDEDIHGTQLYQRFYITEDDINLLPELEGIAHIDITEDFNGFVFGFVNLYLDHLK